MAKSPLYAPALELLIGVVGINIHVLRLIHHAKAQGAKLDRVITIGRLDALLTPSQTEAEFAAFGDPLRPGEAERLLHERDRYCEPIIERLGAKTVDSLDASDYEGASIIHDLNNPIPAKLKKRYSLVLDGGTLEHVFHFPEALKTCMNLAEVGGHVLLCLPANNEMGHGFYQFGPDLFFRAFSEESGYRLKGLYLVPAYLDGEWLEVQDPANHGRIGHNSTVHQLSLLAFAERVADVPIFAKPPQQSDYVAAWARPSANRLEFFDNATATGQKPSRLRSLIPEPVLQLRRIFKAGRYATSGHDPKLFKPFDPRPNRLPKSRTPE